MVLLYQIQTENSRPPRGGRGLKLIGSCPAVRVLRRPPRGGRGLKLYIRGFEIAHSGRPPRGGRGLKYILACKRHLNDLSPSPRRAWIEIVHAPTGLALRAVALPAEGVD